MSFDGAASDDKLNWDVDATNWRSLCRVRWVKQEDAHGCGVACLAMVAGEPYERVRALFVEC